MHTYIHACIHTYIHYITLQCIALHCIALHHITLHYITYILCIYIYIYIHIIHIIIHIIYAYKLVFIHIALVLGVPLLHTLLPGELSVAPGFLDCVQPHDLNAGKAMGVSPWEKSGNSLFPWSNSLLVGGWATPLKNMKVHWDDYSQYMGKEKMATKPPTSN